jgi:hypothetical protein
LSVVIECYDRVVKLAIVVWLCACGGDPDPQPSCDDGWTRNGFTTCDDGCFDSIRALTASGPACLAHSSVGRVDCSKTFVADGITGCCASDLPYIRFAACD